MARRDRRGGGPAAGDTATSFGDRSGEGSTAFSGLAQAPEANLFTGALGTAIQIAVPPGHRNATPSLALQYSSSGGPSPFGYGWDLPIGRIERTTKWGVPRCGSSRFDEFVLSLPGTNAELVSDPPGSDTFRPRVEESFVSAQRDRTANSWVVRDRAGMRYEFGGSQLARIGTDPSTFATVNPDGSCSYTTAWALTKITDPNGNTIHFTWVNFLNLLLPTAVQYGGNDVTGAGHRYSVSFRYEPRPDVPRSYRHGVSTFLWLRLDSVDVAMSIPGPTSTVITTYTLHYRDDQPAQASLLSSVETTGRPTQSFTYAPSVTGHAAPVSFAAPRPFLRSHDASLEVKNTVLDMNGDGLLDYVHWVDNAPWQVWFGGGAGGAFGFASNATSWTKPSGTTLGFGAQIRNVEVDGGDCATGAACTIADTFDITGDGIADYVAAASNWDDWRVFPGRREGGGWGFTETHLSWPAPSQRIRHTTAGGRNIRDVIDMNGDGRPDLVIAGGDPWLVYLNEGNGFATSPIPFALPPEYAGDVGIEPRLTDFNGDGLPDYIRYEAGHTAETDDGLGVPCLLQTTPEYEPYTVGFVVYSHNCMVVYFNTGSGFDPLPRVIETSWDGRGSSSFPSEEFEETNQDLLDVNGDGLPDEVYRYRWDEALHDYVDAWAVRLNTGGDLEPLAVSTYGPEVWNNTGEHGQSWGYAGRVWPGGQGSIRTTGKRRDLADMVDLDGDGMLDRVVAGTTGTENPVPTTWAVQRNRAGAYSLTSAAPSQRPNLMNTMSNGFGGKNTIAYRPSTAYDNTGGDQQPDLPFVTWVVEKTRLSDGLCLAPAGDVFDPASNPCIAEGHERVTKFRYRDGRFDPVEREFRGFREVERITEEARRDAGGSAIDDPDNATLSVYGQATETARRLLTRSSYVGAACVGLNPEPDCSAPVLVHREQHQWSTAPFGGGRTQVWLAQTDSTTIGAWGAPRYLRVENDPPDQYGNLLHSTKYGLVNEALVSAETEYALPASSDGPQVYNRPQRSRTWDATATLSEQWFWYDGYTQDNDRGKVGTGNVTRVRSLLDIAAASGPETRTWYDSYGNITQVRDANGHDTVTEYDPYSLHPVRTRNHLGHEIVTGTDYRWGKVTTALDPNGALSETAYDALGRPSCRARPGETIGACPLRYEYHFADAADPTTWVRMVEKQEPRAPSGCGGAPIPRPDLWTKTYADALGRPRFTDTFRVVNGVAETVRSGDADYDAAGRVLAIRNPYLASGSPPAGDSERRSYVTGDGRIDPLGRVHAEQHSDGSSRTVQYAGVTTRTTDEEGHVSESVVDALGRVQETRTMQGASAYASTTYSYDGAGRLLSVSQAGGGTLKAMTYDALGRKTLMVDQNSGTWRYGYDGVGNLIWQDDPTPGQHMQHCFDALNRPVRRCVWPDDAPLTHTCSSPCADRPENAAYFYDGDDGWTVSNAKGRPTRVLDGAGQYDIEAYDVRGRETRTRRAIEVDGDERRAIVQMAYDANDRVTSTTYPDGEIVLSEYDDSGQPQVLRSASQFYVIDADYDRFGRLTALQHGNNVVDTWSYGGAADRHRLGALSARLPAAPGPYLDLRYDAYDGRGLLTELSDLRDPSNERTNSADFSYDHMGRLTGVDSALAAADRLYAYDALGNITRNGDRFFDYEATNRHQLDKVRQGSPDGPYTSVAHDENGNRTQKFAQTYEYTAEDRVRTIVAGGQVTALTYDHAGRLAARRIGSGGTGITRYYSGLAETTDGILTKWYVLGARRIAMRATSDSAWELAAAPGGDLLRLLTVSAERPMVVVLLTPAVGTALGCAATLLAAGLWWAPWRRPPRAVGIALRPGRAIVVALLWTTGTLPWPLLVQPDTAAAQSGDVIRHFHLDHLGSTQAITDAAGGLAEQIRYHVYGEVRGRWNGSSATLTPPPNGRREFTGYETQLASGLQYAGARFYDPSLGSFLTHDPMAEFPNPYTYVHWDPVNFTDPTGALALATAAFWFFVIGGITASAVQSAINGSGAQQAIEGALVGALSGATFQAAVIGPISTALAHVPNAALYVDAAQIAYGTYSTVEGFRSGQYVQAGFGATLIAYGLAQRLTAGGDVSADRDGDAGCGDDSCRGMRHVRQPPPRLTRERPANDVGDLLENAKEFKEQLETYVKDYGRGLVRQANDEIAGLPGAGPGRRVEGYLFFEQGDGPGVYAARRVVGLSYPGLPDPGAMPIWQSSSGSGGYARVGVTRVHLQGSIGDASGLSSLSSLPVATRPADIGLKSTRWIFGAGDT